MMLLESGFISTVVNGLLNTGFWKSESAMNEDCGGSNGDMVWPLVDLHNGHISLRYVSW